jgi:tetratricopeptide (TPR) repeat protein
MSTTESKGPLRRGRIIALLLILIGVTVGVILIAKGVPVVAGVFFALGIVLAFFQVFPGLAQTFVQILSKLGYKWLGNSKDFFISYHINDRFWAEWIVWQIEKVGYTTMQGALNPQSCENFERDIRKSIARANHTIIILSLEYQKELEDKIEWATAFTKWALTGRKADLLAIRLDLCELRVKSGPIIYIDLFGYDMTRARTAILESLAREYGIPIKEAITPTSEEPPFPRNLPSLRNLPYQHSAFFTDREELLQDIHYAFTVENQHTLALTGLGGIGKTRVAIEYAYRYHNEYQEFLWAKADSDQAISSDFVAIAGLLNLPTEMKKEKEIVAAVKNWLENHDGWLLILDNVEDLQTIRNYIPVEGKGHMLLTTQSFATGGIVNDRKVVTSMASEDGAQFLLRRAKINNPSEADRELATKISEILGGHPLALDQAGAYIEENQRSLSDYLDLLSQKREVELLKNRGRAVADHEASVATTLSLCYEKVKESNPAAAELLQFCAFLDPDAIPEEIITEGAPFLGPTLQSIASHPLGGLDSAIGDLLRYSLILQRNPDTQTLTIHRLVQIILKDKLDKEQQRQWAERAVLAVNRVFPEVDFKTWDRCQQYLPHAQVCLMLIRDWNIAFPEAIYLLDHTGDYLRERARYNEAHEHYNQALLIREQKLGQREYLDVARSLYNLAVLYDRQSKFAQAELLFERTLDIRQQKMSREDPDVIRVLNSLAALYRTQDQFQKAEEIFNRVLTIRERQNGYEHLDVAQTLNDRGLLYFDQGKFAQAEGDFERARNIREKNLGRDNPLVAQTLNDLGRLYYDWGKFNQSEELLVRALDIRQRTLGREDRDVARTLNNLGLLKLAQCEYAEAEKLFKESLDIREKTLGRQHSHIAHNLNNLALLYRLQGKYSDAEKLLKEALEIRERTLGLGHPDVARSLNNLAAIYRDEGKYDQAERLFQQALEIRKEKLGSEHPHLAETLNDLGLLYFKQNDYHQAEKYFKEALAIRQKTLPGLPDEATSLNDLAILYRNQGKINQAEQYFQRALTIREQAFGSDHLSVADVLENYAVLLQETNQQTEAARMENRANTIKLKYNNMDYLT